MASYSLYKAPFAYISLSCDIVTMDVIPAGREGVLDFAYRYPFSKEAKMLVSELNPEFSERYLKGGMLRLRLALKGSVIHFANADMHDIKLAYLMSYVYARMIVSALNDRHAIALYAEAESLRVSEALLEDSIENFMKVSEELNSGISYSSGIFAVRFEKFLMQAPNSEEFALGRQELEKGYIYMGRAAASRLVGSIARQGIRRGLPIPMHELPKSVVEYAKGIRHEYVSAQQATSDARSYAWVERLLARPIPDVRHRTVNLILAPYLVNVRRLKEEEAAEIIVNYIERCKELDPNTRITPSYIKYQCHYAKEKGLRTLSLVRARELLGSVIDAEGL